MSKEELKAFYDADEAYRDYIDKNRENKNLTVEEQLSLRISDLYAEWLIESRKDIHYEGSMRNV